MRCSIVYRTQAKLRLYFISSARRRRFFVILLGSSSGSLSLADNVFTLYLELYVLSAACFLSGHIYACREVTLFYLRDT